MPQSEQIGDETETNQRGIMGGEIEIQTPPEAME
jgi:hypothetical protein